MSLAERVMSRLAGVVVACLVAFGAASAAEHGAFDHAGLARQEELSKLRSQFIAVTSHEFRTPLATIQSSAEIIERYGERLPASEKHDLLGSIGRAVERMTRMIERVLFIGRSDAELLDYAPHELDLAVGEALAPHVPHATVEDDLRVEHLDRVRLVGEQGLSRGRAGLAHASAVASSSNRRLASCRSIAALTSPANSGCAWLGRERSSGCACVAT